MNTFNSGLYLVSTPIGNLDDITLRSLEVLKKSDIILCEDTRRSLKLLNHYEIKKKLFSYHKFNEQKELQKIIEYLNEGKILSLISDAGTPTLTDPGLLLVKKCIEKIMTITQKDLENNYLLILYLMQEIIGKDIDYAFYEKNINMTSLNSYWVVVDKNNNKIANCRYENYDGNKKKFN